MLWIRDILVRNPDLDPALIVSGFPDAYKNKFFFQNLFADLLFEGTFTSVF